MGRRKLIPALAATTLPALAQVPNGFAQTWRHHCIEHWADIKESTMAVFDAMPAGGIGFKPMPVQRPFSAMDNGLAKAFRSTPTAGFS